jgi:hypothetical protein
MTAHRPAKPSRSKTLVKKEKRDSGSPTNKWDVICYAIEDNGRLIRLCVLAFVVGAVLVVGAMLTAPHLLQFWM